MNELLKNNIHWLRWFLINGIFALALYFGLAFDLFQLYCSTVSDILHLIRFFNALAAPCAIERFAK